MAEGFSWSLNVLCGGAWINKLKNITIVKIFIIFGNQNPGSGIGSALT
jgi:hypothetical protein